MAEDGHHQLPEHGAVETPRSRGQFESYRYVLLANGLFVCFMKELYSLCVYASCLPRRALKLAHLGDQVMLIDACALSFNFVCRR
jgi:hypothetical protein